MFTSHCCVPLRSGKTAFKRHETDKRIDIKETSSRAAADQLSINILCSPPLNFQNLPFHFKILVLKFKISFSKLRIFNFFLSLTVKLKENFEENVIFQFIRISLVETIQVHHENQVNIVQYSDGKSRLVLCCVISYIMLLILRDHNYM